MSRLGHPGPPWGPRTLGCGCLAERRLEAPLTSLVDAAARQYPFLPVSLLLRDRFDNLGAAARVRCPVLLLHGEDDVLTPPDEAERLAQAFTVPADVHIVPQHGHNDLPAWPGRRAALRRFLERVAADR